MKVVCISNIGHEGFLTINKVYYAKSNQFFYYDITNDRSGNKNVYNKNSGIFITIQEYREKKLNELEI